MSLHGVEQLIHRLNRSEDLAAEFLRSRQSIVDREARLSAVERQMLLEGDVLGLFRYGVHPLLLVQVSRFFELQLPQFLAAIEPAKGERTR